MCRRIGFFFFISRFFTSFFFQYRIDIQWCNNAVQEAISAVPINIQVQSFQLNRMPYDVSCESEIYFFKNKFNFVYKITYTVYVEKSRFVFIDFKEIQRNLDSVIKKSRNKI